MKLVNLDDLVCHKRKMSGADFGGDFWDEAVLVSDIEKAPIVDAIPRGVLDQVMWERDTAIEQLNSYGVSFGEKADVVKVVRCGDCRYKVFDSINGEYWCKHPFGPSGEIYATGFCNFGDRETDD